MERAIRHDDDLGSGRRLIRRLLLGDEVALQALQDRVELSREQETDGNRAEAREK
jgi:hypothetical protein